VTSQEKRVIIRYVTSGRPHLLVARILVLTIVASHPTFSWSVPELKVLGR
jgi:hypothetical protein